MKIWSKNEVFRYFYPKRTKKHTMLDAYSTKVNQVFVFIGSVILVVDVEELLQCERVAMKNEFHIDTKTLSKTWANKSFSPMKSRMKHFS